MVDDADDASRPRPRRAASRSPPRPTPRRARRRDVSLGPSSASPSLGRPHDPAQRQHVAARDVADEVRDVVVRRRADELLRRRELDDLAVAHDRDPVAEAQRLGQVVGDEEHRLARLVLEADHLVLHVAPDQRVERAEGLVVEHHLRVDGEGARQADPLLHAARELVRELVRASPRARRGAAPRPRGRAAPLGHALHLEAERDVVDHAPVREQAEVLEDHRGGVPPQLAQLRRGSRRRRRARPSRSCPRSARSAGSACGRAWTCPEPERPMTTKISPGQTSNETSRTAATQPCFARSSARGRSASGVPMTRSAWRPKIFQTPSARISGAPERSTPGAARGAVRHRTTVHDCTVLRVLRRVQPSAPRRRCRR